MEKLTLNKLEQYLSKAAWILKGPVDAADFKIYIFPLLFFKRISDVYDEEFQVALEDSGRRYGLCCFSKYRDLSP
jgi:type I restriction enzyme M protein